LYDCFGLTTYSREPRPETAPLPKTDTPGYENLDRPWHEFYADALASPAPTIVATHSPPVDDQPALYIVRDGRLAVRSYLAFHRASRTHPDPNLLGLIAGDDYYGD